MSGSEPRRSETWLGAVMATSGLAAAGAGLGGWVGSAWSWGWWASPLVAAAGAGLGLAWARAGRRAREGRSGAASAPLADRGWPGGTGADAALAATAGALVEAWPDPAMALDADGRLIATSPAARRGWPGATGGRHYEEIFTQSEVLAAIASAAAGQEAACGVKLVGSGGPSALRGRAAPVRPRSGRGPGGGPFGVVLTFTDDSSEAARARADYLANAGHELRTPLAAIRASADTLADGAWDDAGVRERLVRIILSHAARLEAMARGMLDLARLESPDAPARAAPVRGSEIAQGLRDLFEERAARRRVALLVTFDPALERLRTDGPLLTLVLTNLVENAVKFAFEATTVRVEGEARAGAVIFRVIDRGQGIPLAEQPRVFERFYQVDPSRARDGGEATRAVSGPGGGHGAGLGLSLVRRGVERLGGTIRVESVWQQGTTMIVELPGSVEPA